MYNFKDTNDKKVAEASLPAEAMNWDGVFLEKIIPGYRTLAVEGREIANTEFKTTEIDAFDGSMVVTKKNSSRIITVFYQLISKNNAEFRERFNKLNTILSKKEAKFYFNDEADKYFVGIKSNATQVPTGRNSVTSSFDIYCADPYKYSVIPKQLQANLDEGILKMQVNNEGAETAELSFEATMTSDNGFLGAVGPLGDVEIGAINEIDGYMDMAETVYVDQMVPADTSKWTVNAGYIAWSNSNVGLPNKVQGAFTWGPESVKATNFGTAFADNRWYGPTLSKAIKAKTSDNKRDGNFVHRFWLNHKSNGNARCVGRQEINLSNGKDPIATFVIYDDIANSIRTCLEFTLFGIKKARIVVDKSFQEFYGTVEIMKVENEISFKVYNMDNKQTITRTYYDEQIGTAQVTHTTYWCSRFMNLPICDMSLNYSYFQWIGSQSFVDVPNRYSTGDVLRYDGTTGKFYVNDTLTMNDIIQGSTDLKIPPGTSTVEFYYSDFGKTPPVITGEIRERWL